jgi:corrinoid protein of di/trimethylamine methyltransferase
MAILQEISEFLQKGDFKEVQALVQQALDQGLGARVILEEGLLPGMNIIGEQFKNNDVYIPEVLIAARAMNAGVALLKPHFASAGVEAKGKVLIGTVEGDLHDVGKNLVRTMMEAKGFQVIDLGVNVPAAKFVQAIADHGADIVALSAMLTTTMDQMRMVIEAIGAAGLRDKVKVMIGGAPITDGFRVRIGADGYAPDAASASDDAVALIANRAV